MTHKTLTIPYLPELESLHGAQAVMHTLEAQGVRQMIDYAPWAQEYPYKPVATFTAAHSGNAIYIDFFVRCNYLRAVNYLPQSPVSQDSCVEFFVQPHPQGEYWNFEFNCIGTINASHRMVKPSPTRLSDDELNKIGVVSSCGQRPFCELEGLFTWNLLVCIPLSLIGVEYDGKPIEMRGNFYKCASMTSAPHYLTWNPLSGPKPNFHQPEGFGKIILA